MIDSHCHLDHEPLFSDLTNIIQRSKNAGIKKLLTISTSLESFARIKDIVARDEMIYGTIGVHPHETNEEFVNSEIIVKNFNENSKIIGIGETCPRALEISRDIRLYERKFSPLAVASLG